MFEVCYYFKGTNRTTLKRTIEQAETKKHERPTEVHIKLRKLVENTNSS